MWRKVTHAQENMQADTFKRWLELFLKCVPGVVVAVIILPAVKVTSVWRTRTNPPGGVKLTSGQTVRFV